jgi:Ycf66 protein N-terminus
MLANLLAIVVGLASFSFYMAAFVLPEVHRKSDFLWSGVGMFYALVLWFCAGQVQGAVLLGQTAATTLLLWLGWQTLLMRRMTTPAAQQTPAITISFGQSSAKAARQRLDSVTAKRRIAQDYEFLEDGVPSTPEPISTENPFELVVPAAIPKPEPEPVASSTAQVTPELAPDPQLAAPIDIQPQLEQTQPEQTQPNLLDKASTLGGWLKDLVSTKPAPKPSYPMIELPPRPPSIPRPEKKSDEPQSPSAEASPPVLKGSFGKTSIARPTPSPSSDLTPPPDIAPPDPIPPDLTSPPDLTPSDISPTNPTPPDNGTEPEWPDDEDSNWPDDL